MKNGKLRVALVGVSFGAEFIPIYLKHPDVDSLVLVDTNEKLLNTVGDKFLLEERLTDFNAMLEDKTIDAVHLVTPPATHAPLSIQVMNAGKHCACTIPMGMSIDELYQVIDARKRSGKHYMFMETSVYGREFLYVKNLYEKGELGRIQFMRCAHYQDMEGWPDYWLGFPPLMHPTHAVAPCLMLLGKRPETVYCKGSGKVRKEVEAPYGCPYAFESALISLKDSDVSIEMARFLYHVARGYTESFNIYGERKSFEWQQLESEQPVLFSMALGANAEHVMNDYGRGGLVTEERIQIPDYADRLPAEIGRFTKQTVYDDSNPHLSFLQGGGHGGSHPHLVHEFVRSILEDRTPVPSDIDGAYWTGVGICAHQSAMDGGVVKRVPVPHRLGSYVMKRSVSVKFILTIAKSKEQNNRPLVESSLKTIFFFCLSSGFTQGGAVVSRKQNSQPKAIFFADIDAGNGPFISRKKKRKCRSCTKRKSKNQISDSADGF